MHTKFSSEILEGRNHWEGNIRMDLREIGSESVNRIHLTQDRDQWQALVNTIMSLRFS
jgi:hypothetical protein